MPRLMLVLAMLACLTGLAPGARAGEVLVVIDATGTGTDLQPGTTVNLDDFVSLPAGARISLLNQEGRLVLVKGPFDGSLSSVVTATKTKAGNDDVMEKIAGLMEGKDSVVAFGASRALGTAPTAPVPHPALISVMAPGPRCVVATAPQLWRKDATSDESLTLTGPDGKSVTLAWPAGKDRIAMPAAFMVDNTELEATLAGKQVTLTLNLPPSNVRNVSQILAWLGERHCNGQAAALLKILRQEARAAQ